MSDIDRRKFLKQSGAALGGLVAAPRVGLLGLLGAAVIGVAAGSEDAGAIPVLGNRRRLLRSGEPVNARGEPFGYSIDGIAVVNVPAAVPGTRVLAVVAHERACASGQVEAVAARSVGISALELVREEHGGWRHEIASHHNRRWHLETPVPLEGARLLPDAPMLRVQEEGPGLGSVCCAIATPWMTALCAERDGWIVELNPLSGVAVRRFTMGRVRATSLKLVATRGKPAALYLAGKYLYKFVSHQRHDGRLVQANRAIFLLGELFVADLSCCKWISLTKGLLGDPWQAVVRDPESAALALGVTPLEAAFDLDRLTEEDTSSDAEESRFAIGVDRAEKSLPISESHAFSAETLEDGSAAFVSTSG